MPALFHREFSVKQLVLEPPQDVYLPKGDKFSYHFLGCGILEDPSSKRKNKTLFDTNVRDCLSRIASMDLYVQEGEGPNVGRVYYYLQIPKDKVARYEEAILALITYCYVMITLFGNGTYMDFISPWQCIKTSEFNGWGVCLCQDCIINGLHIPTAIIYRKNGDKFTLMVPPMGRFTDHVQGIYQVIAVDPLPCDELTEQGEENALIVIHKWPTKEK